MAHELAMIIDDFNIVGMTCLPSEADAPLLIDPDAILSSSIAGQLFQTVARWNS